MAKEAKTNAMRMLDRQKIKVETGHRNLLVYTDATEQWAISLARSFRAKGKNVEMMKRNSWDERETFEAYGDRGCPYGLRCDGSTDGNRGSAAESIYL